MMVLVFLMLLLGELPRMFSSELVIKSNICGPNCFVYPNAYGSELVYINGYMVEKHVFCRTLKSHSDNDCVISAIGRTLELLSVSLPTIAGRKLLQKDVNQKSTSEHENDIESWLTPKNVAMAAGGLLILCCSFIFPCFRARKRATAHEVLSKDLSSFNSASDIEMNFVSEKIPGSPLRVPHSPRFSMSPKLSRHGSVHLNLSQIFQGTHNFSSSCRIGEGGFGTVYKAKLPDGQMVAIKRAKKEHFENLRTKFSCEVELLSKIDHQSLVKLLGFVDKDDECIIITEYVPNGTLREHLDGDHGKSLDFNQRLQISIDIAHGLTYLHMYAEKTIIHRDVKASNILLTGNYRAKVADFGFASFGPVESEHTHVSTKVKGLGYVDPEYMKTLELTTKSDVYSFGVLLIEILTGRRPLELKRATDERVTLIWAFNKYNEGKVVEIVDPLLEETVDADILEKMFGLAIHCAAPTRSDRPNMRSVGEQLWRIRFDYVKSLGR